MLCSGIRVWGFVGLDSRIEGLGFRVLSLASSSVLCMQNVTEVLCMQNVTEEED